jgi:hypothetical protein
MLAVLLLLPLSLAMDDGKFDHGDGGGGGGHPAAAAAMVVVAIDDDWRQKRPATRASTVALRCAMTKADGRQQRKQPTNDGNSKGGQWRWWQWQQRQQR